MTANVFFIIMPNQRIVVDDLKNGRTPDPKYGKIAKLREKGDKLGTDNSELDRDIGTLEKEMHAPSRPVGGRRWWPGVG